MAGSGLILALGGGGARGFAHLGVLQVLVRKKVPLQGLVGTSMGAVAAALFAVGTDLDRLEEFAMAFPWENLFTFSLSGLGIASGERILAVLDLLTKGKSFADLTLPVWVVATDLERGSPVVLRDGPLATAVRASISVPGFFAPLSMDGRTLVDGAVVAGIPVEIARQMGRPVVAVDVGFEFQARRARHFLDVLSKVVKIMGTELDRHQVAQADLVIRPDVGSMGSARFDLVKESIESGRRAAEEALPDLWKLIQGSQRA